MDFFSVDMIFNPLEILYTTFFRAQLTSRFLTQKLSLWGKTQVRSTLRLTILRSVLAKKSTHNCLSSTKPAGCKQILK